MTLRVAMRVEADAGAARAEILSLQPALASVGQAANTTSVAGRSAAAAIGEIGAAAGRVAPAAAQMGQALNSVRNGSQAFRTGLQQAGFQVGDFATQVQLGTNPLIAFGQQAGQLLGAFGPWGAVIGGAVTVLGALATGLFSAGEASATTAELIDAFSGAAEAASDAAITGASGVQQLIETYGRLDAALLSAIRNQTQYNLITQNRARRDAVSALAGELDTQLGAGATLGLPRDVAVPITGITRDLQREGDPVVQKILLQELDRLFNDAGSTGLNSRPELQDLGDKVTEATLAIRKYEEALRDAAQSEELLSKPIPELNALAATVGAPKGRTGSGGARTGDRAGAADDRRADRVLADLAAQVAANDRLTAARLQSADAVRQALVVEAQEQALRRAGLEVADLAGGADQARAQQIAALAGQLYAQSDAQKTVTEVTRAYGDIAGTSYADAAAEIDRWREGALLSLGAVGQGHADLVAQIDAIANARLREAYDADLASRTDWQAGVERGIRNILDDHRSLADEVEDLLGTMSQTGEDAFVQLATTGKIQTRDLVEFALRQFFRLAQQAALSLATGGNGGVLGQIFSAITGVVLGGGGGSPISGVVGSSGMFGSIHTGGMVADAPLTHRLNSAVFAGAPRLHSGGLLPGERPAILLDDERVLTAAQQQSTAETITGLASLVRSGMGGGGGGGTTAVQINIYGAPGEARVRQSQGDDGATIDIFFDQIEGRLAQNAAAGRGPLVQAIGGRFELRPRGAV